MQIEFPLFQGSLESIKHRFWSLWQKVREKLWPYVKSTKKQVVPVSDLQVVTWLGVGERKGRGKTLL